MEAENTIINVEEDNTIEDDTKEICDSEEILAPKVFICLRR